MSGFAIGSTPFAVRDLARLKGTGRLFLPDLQRGFVWDVERVRMLFDSLYRGYPVGSLLLWKPVREGTDPAIGVRAWDLAPAGGPTGIGIPDPLGTPPDDAMFVLDGQQRLTSLFKVLFDSREVGRSVSDPELFVSLSTHERWAAQPFLYKSRQIGRDQERDGLIVPAATLFAGVRSESANGAESKAVARAIAQWVHPADDAFYPAMDRASRIRNAILNAEVAAYELGTSATDDNVIEIFGRLNQQAVRLTPADLAAARLTGKMERFRARADEVLQALPEGFAIREGAERATYGGRVDTDLLVRVALCLATGHIKYRDAEKVREGGVEVYAKVEEHWGTAAAAVGRFTRLVAGLGIPDGDWLPYRYLLLVPAVAGGSGKEREPREWLGWLLAASFWGLYAGSAETKAQHDARLAREGDWSGLWDSLKNHARRPETLIPDVADLQHGLVSNPGVLLAMLLLLRAQDAASLYGTRFQSEQGTQIDVHHIFPRALFTGKGRGPRDASKLPDRIGNLTLLTASDNRSLGASEPRAYLAAAPPTFLSQHLIPPDPDLWELTRYADFCSAREALIQARVASLLRALGVP